MTEFLYEMAGRNLKRKYRERKPMTQHGAVSGNSGKPVRGTPPAGMPRAYRGKTSFR
jgi:hypothetical protein